MPRLGLLLAVAAGLHAAGKPVLEQTSIFEAGTAGYAHYRIPAIVVSPRGTLLAFVEARKSRSGDWGPQDILMRRSRDRGRTWDAPRAVARVDSPIEPNPVALAQNLDRPGDITYNNPVPIVDMRRRVVHLLFCAEYARCWSTRTADDGGSFSRPVEITATFEQFRRDYGWRVIATGPGHGIQLRNGRLLVPVWLSDGTGGHAHRPSIVSVIYSDDGGATWQRGEVAVRHPEFRNPSETLAIQLADGRVALNIRTEADEHRRLISFSQDGASGWSAPKFHPQLIEPVCMASLIRHSLKGRDGRSRIVFANPESTEPRDPQRPLGNWKRQNMTVKLSYDEGETWPVSHVLEPGAAGYSDLAVDARGFIYCMYERGAVSGSDTYIGRITVARFNLEWLESRK